MHTSEGRWVIGVLLLSSVSVALAQLPCGYTVEAIIQGPPLPPPSQSQPPTTVTGMNNVGQVVGSHATLGDYSRGFVWSKETGIQWLPVPPGAYAVLPADINDHGVIVGQIERPGGTRGFVYENGHYTILEPAPGGLWCWAIGINNAGQVVGARSVGNPDTPGDDVNPMQVFRWSDGVLQDLGTMVGKQSEAFAISEAGQVVGWSGSSAGNSKPFLWENGHFVPLLPGFDVITGAGMGFGPEGEVVGTVRLALPDGQGQISRAFVRNDASVTLLEPLHGFAISSGTAYWRGMVLGRSSSIGVSSTTWPGTYWIDGIPHDLNWVTPPGSNVHVSGVKRVSSNGAILANGFTGLHSVGLFLRPAHGHNGDLNRDGKVDHEDLAILLADFGCAGAPGSCAGDIDGDGQTDQRDLGALLSEFGLP